MKKLICTVFVILFATHALAANYYVSTSGIDDSGDGSQSAPWATGAYALSQISDGDTIYFQRGGQWHESLTISHHNITLDAYGTGPRPILTGSEPVTGWSVYSGSIFKATFSGTVYQLLEDNAWALLSHEPDNGYFTTDGASPSPGVLLDTPEGINGIYITGADLHLRLEDWYVLGYRVSGYDNGSITLYNDSRSDPMVGSGKTYYLCNKLKYLDTPGEWYSNKAMLFYRAGDDADPDTHTIEASTLRKGIYAKNIDNLTIRHIEIKNFGSFGVHLLDCLSPVITDCAVHHIGSHKYDGYGDGFPERTNIGLYLDGRGNRTSEGGEISANVINEIQGDGIWLQNHDGAVLNGNAIRRIGMHGGDAYAPRGHGPTGMNGIVIHASHGVACTNNTVEETGYNGISIHEAQNTLVQLNTVQKTIQLLNNGGGIYVGGHNTAGSSIDQNTILETGPIHTAQRAQNAIYLNMGTDDVGITSNTIERAPRCMMLRSARGSVITGNKCSEVFNGIWMNSVTDGLFDDYAGGHVFTHNEVYCHDLGGKVMIMTDLHAGPGQTVGLAAGMDDNTYWPNNSDSFQLSTSPDGTYGSSTSWQRDLAGWRAVTAAKLDGGELDTHSTAAPLDGIYTIDARVAAGEDDAEESATGVVNLASSDLELVKAELTPGDQTVGLRFRDLAVEPGATITEAYIQFQVDEPTSETTALILKGQAIDTAPAFESASCNISSRATTQSSATWSPEAWDTVGQADTAQRTADIAAIIQEIVHRPGWQSGNALAILITGNGLRVAESYNGMPGAAPLLHVAYTTEPVTDPPPTAAITATPSTILFGGSATLNWTSTDATTCTIEPGMGAVDANGSITVSPSETTTYTITAGGPGGTATAQVTVSVDHLPSIANFQASPDTIIHGESAALSWTSEYASSATIDQGIGTVPVNGSVTVSPTETTTYTITMIGPGGTAAAQATVTVNPPPTAILTADPETIILGESSTLQWTTTHADSAVMEPGIGPVDPSGMLNVQPTDTTTYTLTATGPGGSVTGTVTITVLYPPAVTLSADPATVMQGESTTLAWNATNADTCTIEPDVGAVAPSGAIEVTPDQDTTYTITATGAGGTATAQAAVTVVLHGPPTVTLDPANSTIAQGESITLSWSSTGATAAHIDNGVGTVPTSGAITLTPDHTTIYTLTATGPDGSANATAQVHVTATPPPQPEGSFGDQYDDLIPDDATASDYDPDRFSVITGLIQDNSGNPLEDVLITILHHPEYGTTVTDSAGRFSIPVEGGGYMKVDCRKTGYMRVQRQVDVPWNDIAISKPFVMLPADTAATEIALDGNPSTVITHRSTPTVDSDGSRANTIVLTGDTHAYLVDESGNDVHQLSTIVARATEFTTPQSMPAELPPNSAFTYCAELTVDGVDRVRFDKPIVNYVENFLEFDVGTPVPVGYYDKDQGKWVPADNGVVVQLLDDDNDGTVDSLDADGDGQPDDLNGDGQFADDAAGLQDASVYAPGATYWRVTLTHFTPWDCNWPYGPPEGAKRPPFSGQPYVDQSNGFNDPCKNRTGSYAEPRNRVHHEDDIPILGTDMHLHYASNKSDGYLQVISVPASGDEEIPAIVKAITVKVKVAGKTMVQTLDPLPNQVVDFSWDGLDFTGRELQGNVKAAIEVGYTYDAQYYDPGDFNRAFGQNGLPITGLRQRGEITLWKGKKIDILMQKSHGKLANGWNISTHHGMNMQDLTRLYKGDGTISTNSLVLISTLAGNGTAGFSGDNGPAGDAMLNNPSGIDFDAQGNLYIADAENHRIRKVDTDGIITTVAGNGDSNYGGDRGPATAAGLVSPVDVTVDTIGNLYIADMSNHRIRKVDTDGIITTFAGTGVSGSGGQGDNGPAVEALLYSPTSVAIDSAGNLYIAEWHNHRLRKVDPSGMISTTAGQYYGGYNGDGRPAAEAELFYPDSVEVDTHGNIYIGEGEGTNNLRVRRIGIDGMISTFAGSGDYGFSGDGGPATAANFGCISGLAADGAGNLFVVDRKNIRVRRVDVRGYITTAAGSGNWLVNDLTNYEWGGDGGPATEALLARPHDVTIDGSGYLYIADGNSNSIRRVGPPSSLGAYVHGTDFPFSDENGLVHIMSDKGLHKSTLDPLTGVQLLTFGYDNEDRLITITDQFGNQMTVNRDADGRPVSILSPDGATTQLSVDADNNLTAVSYPDSSGYTFAYGDGGLLTAKVAPNGNRFDHQYDANGRLTDTTDQAGGHWQYSRTFQDSGENLFEVLTAEGNRTTYLDKTDSTGQYTSTITDPNGGESRYERSADDLTVQKSTACGMDATLIYDVDPEYHYKYIREAAESTPSLLTRLTEREKTYQDIDGDQDKDLITETFTLNGNPTTYTHNLSTSEKTITSPEGRTITSQYDPATLQLLSVNRPGLFDETYAYDARGRVTAIDQGTRSQGFAYDGDGNLASLTLSGQQTYQYQYDSQRRLTWIERPDGSDVQFTYDASGNMTVLTTPSTVAHNFVYNSVSELDVYQAPISGNYTYSYDRDRQLTGITFPSGRQITNIYDRVRLSRIQMPHGSVEMTYLCNGKLDTTTLGTESVDYDYDGKLVTGETLSGTLNHIIAYTYNNDFNLDSMTYAGETTSFSYDNDGLLTAAGQFQIARNADNGLPESVSRGNSFDLSRSFNGFGEVNSQSVTVSGQSALAWSLMHDDLGRISQKTETIDGQTATFDYTYDAVGRLLTVTRNGTLVEEYGYDVAGTRASETNALRGIAGRTFSYSDEDHLLTAGSTAYNYDPDGFLTTKTDGAQVTTYNYSVRGELLRVDLPDGTVIDYIHDPMGRRIAKRVNGTIVEKYLWQGLTTLLAVYDGSDNLIQRFEYAGGRLPEAMTQAGVSYYLAYDQVGSLRLVADGAGNVVKRIDYDTFGNIIDDTDPAFAVPFGFAGGLHDRLTGLVRFGHRDYDPDTGRWTAKDPIFFGGGDTDLYGYTQNDPSNYIDSLGLTSNGYSGLINEINRATAWWQIKRTSTIWAGKKVLRPNSIASTLAKPFGRYAQFARSAGPFNPRVSLGLSQILWLEPYEAYNLTRGLRIIFEEGGRSTIRLQLEMAYDILNLDPC